MEPTNCTHILATLAEEDASEPILTRYKSVVSWNAHRLRDTMQPPAKRRKISCPSCDTCGSVLLRPFLCLQCSYAGCHTGGHALDHLKSAGHRFAVDIKSGYVFCAECDDFIFNPTIDRIHLSTTVSAEEKQTRFQVAKKGREPFKSWTPTEKDLAALEGSVAIPCQGRRGLVNLGQTCFLNVVLQSFIHNPLLRNFFLSDRHNMRLCKIKDCTSCEMDKLFSEFYSGNTAPYGPTTFLAATWRASSELSGYAQQDAHEFFISALNQIHATSRGSTNVSCNCIIHSTFAGQLQSDVKCEKCGNVTSTVDPMLDVSLELRGGKSADVVSPENTLAGCLRRFTQPEKLGPKEYSCARCSKASHEANKRLSIRKLPPVLSFQFKRFEHKTPDKSAAQARKIDAPVRFPVTLNMAPYTTRVMSMNDQDAEGENSGYAGPEAMYDYDLFAVIVHEGQLNNGHYTNFARFQDEWYRFDDDKVTHTSLTSVLSSAAYMCFYVKRHLDYKHMTPSYVLTREVEAVKEKEIEREREAARMREVDDALRAYV